MTETSQHTAPTEITAPRPVQRVDKPWGHEEIFAMVEGGYVGKLLTVRAGESLSLQYHHEKDETIALVTNHTNSTSAPRPTPWPSFRCGPVRRCTCRRACCTG